MSRLIIACERKKTKWKYKCFEKNKSLKGSEADFAEVKSFSVSL